MGDDGCVCLHQSKSLALWRTIVVRASRIRVVPKFAREEQSGPSNEPSLEPDSQIRARDNFSVSITSPATIMSPVISQDCRMSVADLVWGLLLILTAGILLIAGPSDSMAQTRSWIDSSPTQIKTEPSPERARPGRVESPGYRNEESTREESKVGAVPEWAESRSRNESFGSSTPDGALRPNDTDPGRPVPIDGGLIWLVLAGLGYGGYQLGRTQ